MRGVIIVGGEGPAPEILKNIAQDADILVAADSGLITAESAELKPDWILGDMDSLDDIGRLEKYPVERVLRYPTGKDFTDTELAFKFLEEKGCDEIWIAGGGGGRIDHLFAVRSLFERDNPPDKWFTADLEIQCLRDGKYLKERRGAGSVVSVFPLGNGPWNAESSGLKWPLDGLKWDRGSFGISNLVAESSFEIHSASGRFMVIMRL